jgi:hypothetical protein
MDWNTIVTSAAVGALVAGGMQIVAQAMAGRRRRREQIFRFAVEAARAQRSNALLASRTSGITVDLRDPLYLAAEYYPLVSNLYDRGQLPPDAKPEA